MPGRVVDRVGYDRLRKLLSYDKVSGFLSWSGYAESEGSSRGRAKRIAGTRCFCGVNNNGYFVGCIDRVHLLAHQVIWLIETGQSARFIDHINGIRTDNSWQNLREVTGFENMRNVRRIKLADRKLPVGVYPYGDRFRARIGVDRKRKSLGYFDTVEEAAEAYRTEAAKLGFTPHHGTPLNINHADGASQ